MNAANAQPDPRGDSAALWAIRRVLAGIPAEVAWMVVLLNRLADLGYMPAGLRPGMEEWTERLTASVENLRSVLSELGKSRFIEMVAEAVGEARPVANSARAYQMNERGGKNGL